MGVFMVLAELTWFHNWRDAASQIDSKCFLKRIFQLAIIPDEVNWVAVYRGIGKTPQTIFARALYKPFNFITLWLSWAFHSYFN